MGIKLYTHVGAYIKATMNTEEYPETKTIGCSSGHGTVPKPHERIDYCPTCGEKLEKSTTVKHRHMSYYDLFKTDEEEKWLDILQWVGGESDDNEHVLLIGNMGTEKFPDCIDLDDDDDEEEVEITPEMATVYVKNFKRTYADIINFITSRVKALEIKFGVVTYYT